MRPSRLVLFTLALGVLAACAAPADQDFRSDPDAGEPVTFDPAGYGPGDYCADTYVLLQPTTRSNFSLGSEYYRNGDYCAAYPYIKNLVETDPLFTGEDPDDRNFLRLASIYEDFAANVDSTNQAERVAYLDSALAARSQGVALMDERGIEYDSYLRDLREGFFYFTNAPYYDDASEREFEAFRRAFEAQPDSVEDWYLTRLFEGSAAEFGDEIPNPDRAAFVRSLSDRIETAALAENYVAFADYIETEPSPQDQVAGTDAAVIELLEGLDAQTLTYEQALTILSTAQQQPSRIEDQDRDPEEVITQVAGLEVVQDNLTNPRVLFAISQRERRNGNAARANELFERALSNAESNAQRADFYYTRGQYDQALRVFPNHGPSLYRRATQIAQAVGRPTSLRGRFAYWCLADEFRSVAARTSGSIASNARSTAAQYERAGPSREQYFLEGFRPGQTVSASLGAYGSCSTRVR